MTEAALMDWVAMLEDQSQEAIEHACSMYLRNQPRRRPTPGDIRAMAEEWSRNLRSRGNDADEEPTEEWRTAPLSPEQVRVVDWAVSFGLMSYTAAADAVRRSRNPEATWPTWLPDSPAQRAVYVLRHAAKEQQ